MTRPLVVGNWKMHGGPTTCVELARKIADELQRQAASVEVALAPPFPALPAVKNSIKKGTVELAAQNCHWEDSGAFTGEVSPAMLAEIGCSFVIVGHSERRQLFCETDDLIAKKLPGVIRDGMRPILCVGETLEERERKQTSIVITRQLDSALKGMREGGIDKLEIAYEPVWAIGTGLNASDEQIRETHTQIKEFISNRFGEAQGGRTRILYGGSVKPDNAQNIAKIDVVSGVLVGGASLVAESFISIVRAFSDKNI
jgi:triosephosphate isomerase (TIM)